jgi:hypothetical protein
MNNPAAANCGVSELGDEICVKCVTLECINRGSSFGLAWISRLEHAGMTDSRRSGNSLYAASGESTKEIEIGLR